MILVVYIHLSFQLLTHHFLHHLLTITIETKLQLNSRCSSRRQRAIAGFMLRLITQFFSRHEDDDGEFAQLMPFNFLNFVNEKLHSQLHARCWRRNSLFFSITFFFWVRNFFMEKLFAISMKTLSNKTIKALLYYENFMHWESII